jgi:hypothetical protein
MHCGYTLCTTATGTVQFLNLAPCDDPNKDAVLPLPLGMYKTIMAELQWKKSASGLF